MSKLIRTGDIRFINGKTIPGMCKLCGGELSKNSIGEIWCYGYCCKNSRYERIRNNLP